MAKRSIPLFDLKLSREARRLVREVIESGWLNTGPKTAAFEQEVARRAGVKYATAVNSATAGLQLALEALGVGKGDEVITSPFTFAATTAAIIRTGAVPIPVDIDPGTLNVDPGQVEKRTTRRTRAVLPVDIAGLPADYPALRRICRKRKLHLVSDAAHSFGASIDGKPVPLWADVTIHSFQATKNMTTADGGMVLSRKKSVIDRVRLLGSHAMTATAYTRLKSRRWEYDVVGLGMKANLSDLHAAVGLGQLSVFDETQRIRTRLAERYRSSLNDISELVELPSVPERFESAWHLFIIRLNLRALKISRNRFVELMKSEGIQCGVHYKPLFEMSYYRKLGWRAVDCPQAAGAGKSVVSLPLYPNLTNRDIDFVCGRIRTILTAHSR